jgi:hypothetical protein
MTVSYGDAEKALYVRKKFPTSYLALSQKNLHAFQSSECKHFYMRLLTCQIRIADYGIRLVSSMPDGPDHPESWIFHMAMAWMGESDNKMSYPERLAMIKGKAESLGEPARSAFMWMPKETEVHKADISYWVSQPWNNYQGKLTLVGDAAHPMPPCM